MKAKLKETFGKVLLIWAIFAAAISACYFFILMPQARKLDVLYSRLDKKIAKNLVIANADNERAESIMDKRVKEAEDLISEFLIRKEDVNGMIFKFNRLASEANVSNFSASYSPESSYRKVTGFKHIGQGTIRLNFTANFKEFMSMLSKLETYTPVVFVDRFDISEPKMGNEKNNINILLTFYTDKETKT
ncbi:hypothetical protein [Sedimentisphaera salicampi]|uniref:Pilus assembly protein, PilO n=1 Tax=Sedimentisphaera salicampi TaxID=1941349 RepID=A0A1W6LIU8_9BACT|nr:hypothetical protein [Sedimentisphaera salicampi]ARN55718.1 hypothetical protein STSP1_00082 [Sedimentisphaera salicampi]